jgi:hypothetical protein
MGAPTPNSSRAESRGPRAGRGTIDPIVTDGAIASCAARSSRSLHIANGSQRRDAIVSQDEPEHVQSKSGYAMVARELRATIARSARPPPSRLGRRHVQ